jgi:hypothetical protein
MWNSSLKIRTITFFAFFYFEDVVSIAGATKKKEYIWQYENLDIYINYFCSGSMSIVLLA